ncbi:MAG: hypothetical protein GC200_05180 [Tepidisphaera sp.]|nr:hypothetical protein [Tepidisphaera sp.]
MDNAPTIPPLKRQHLRFLAAFLAIPAIILLSLHALSGFGRTHDKRPSADVAIDIAIANLHDAPSLASSILARSTRAIDAPIPTLEPGRTVGLTTNSDDRRTLILYYTQRGTNDPVIHSAQLLDKRACTATWLMLDQSRMKEYLDVAARTTLPAGPPDP